MPTIQANGCAINVVTEGPENAPVLMLSNSLGTTHRMWDGQVAPFTKHFRLVRFDRRGHGGSGVTPAPYNFEQLSRDALAVADGLGIKTFNWCGLSMGGMEGMWLGANAPERIEKLILSNTSAYFADKAMWEGRLKTVREKGLAAIVGPNMERWFTAGFRERSPETIAMFTEMFLSTPVEGYVGCACAVRDMDHREILTNIRVPTLIIAGRHDPATNLEAAQFIHERVKGSKLAVLEAAHISNLERPEEYAKTVIDFLAPGARA